MASRNAMPTPQGGSYVGGKLPPPENSGGGDFNDFLKAKHIGKGKVGDTAKVKLTGKNRPNSGQFGEGLNLEVTVPGKKDKYDWSVKFSSASYRSLFSRFGNNPVKWKGVVTVEVDTYLGKQYIKVAD